MVHDDAHRAAPRHRADLTEYELLHFAVAATLTHLHYCDSLEKATLKGIQHHGEEDQEKETRESKGWEEEGRDCLVSIVSIPAVQEEEHRLPNSVHPLQVFHASYL